MQEVRSEILVFYISSTIIILILVVLIIFIVGSYQRKQVGNRITVTELERTYEKNIMSAQLEIQEDTFKHISREIHDNVSLTLTLAKLKLNTIDWSTDANQRDHIASTISLISSAIKNLRYLSSGLNPEVVLSNGFIQAISMEIQRIIEMKVIKCTLQVEGEIVFLDNDKELILVRIAQEALNNIIKHSKATEATLSLKYGVNCLEIIFADNGIGLLSIDDPPLRPLSSGLINMKNRTLLLGGLLTIADNQPGTKLHFQIPYKNERFNHAQSRFS